MIINYHNKENGEWGRRAESLSDFIENINFVFIDTNIYEDVKMCSGEPYPENARRMQFEWLANVLKENRDSWNIVIGHIPFIANSHKEDKPTRFSENLFMDLTTLSELNLFFLE